MKFSKQVKIKERQAQAWMDVCHEAMNLFPTRFPLTAKPKMRRSVGIVIDLLAELAKLKKGGMTDGSYGFRIERYKSPMSNAKITNLVASDEETLDFVPPALQYQMDRAEALYGEKPDGIELQLLVVDLGDSCVVKVEKGEEVVVNFGTDWWFRVTDSDVIRHTFADIRAAVDAIDEKPVPRIELSSNIGEGLQTYRLYLSPDGFKVVDSQRSLVLDTPDYNALCQLAGKPLPIWTPTKGEWVQLFGIDSLIDSHVLPSRLAALSVAAQFGRACGKALGEYMQKIPVEIWRYTRRAAAMPEETATRSSPAHLNNNQLP